jgi:hypothetical protein
MHKIKFKIFWEDEKYVIIELERLDTVFWITYIAIKKWYQNLLETDFLINPFNDEKIKVINWDSFEWNIRAGIPAHNYEDFDFAKNNNLEIRQSIAKDFIYTGDNAPREICETLNRETIDVILENDKWNFLLEVENHTNWKHIHFIWGWIEEWQSELDAVKAEIIEETGYTDFEIIWPINLSFASSFWYRDSKKKNQKCLWRVFYVKLKSSIQIKSEIEDWKHKIIWVKKDDVLKRITWEWHKDFWNWFIKWEKPFIEKWVLVNSWEFDRLESKVAEKELLKLAKKEGFLVEEK